MRSIGRLAAALSAAAGLALLAGPVAAGGKGGSAGLGAAQARGNAGGAVRGLDRASQKASPQGQLGIQKAQEAISNAAQKNPKVQEHNPNVLPPPPTQR